MRRITVVKTVNCFGFMFQLHLVHWNCEKYASFSEAAGQADGLAVLGILWEVSIHTPHKVITTGTFTTGHNSGTGVIPPS